MTEHASREDLLELPPNWQLLALPRRSNAVRPRVGADPEAAALYDARLEAAPALLGLARAAEGSDPALVARAEAYSGGAPDPVGAAVIAELIDRRAVLERLAGGVRPDGHYRGRTHVEAWLDRHGLAFALCAAVEELSLRPLRPHRDAVFHTVAYGDADARRWDRWAADGQGLDLLRSRLAEASREDYDAAVDAVAAHRDSAAKRYAAAVLVPDREDWVTEVLSDARRPSGTKVFDRLAWSMMGNVEHLALQRRSINPGTFDARSVADLVANLGERALGVLGATLRFKRLDPARRRTVLQGIALIPADRAVSLILDSDEHYGADEAFASVAARFPARTARIVRARAAAAPPGERSRLLGSLRAQPNVAALLEAEDAAAREDRIELPERWRGRALPRRANTVREGYTPDPEAVARYRERLSAAPELLALAAANPYGDGDLVDRARAHLDGEPNPVGAAVVAELLDRAVFRERRSWTDRPPLDPRLGRDRLDAWVLGHGLPFAAAATATALTLRYVSRFATQQHLVLQGPLSNDRMRRWLHGERLLYALRDMIAEASTEEYREVVAAVGAHRSTPEERFAASVVLPDETDWAAAVLAAPPLLHDACHYDRLMWSIVGDPSHLTEHRARIEPKAFSIDIVADLIVNLGTDSLPVLTATLARKRLNKPARKSLLLGIACLPSEAAMSVLLDESGRPGADEALQEAVGRFPTRTARVLRERAHSAAPGERARLLGILATVGLPGIEETPVPEARNEDLPRVLVAPPWTETRKPKVPTRIDGITVPEPQLVGRPGEFERARALEPDLVSWEEPHWERGPGFDGYDTGWRYTDMCLSALAVHGTAVADGVVEGIRKEPANGHVLRPIRSVPAAATAAHWLLRVNGAKGPALDWFDRHGLHAVALLVPDAFGPKAYQRTTARGALRLLAWRHGAEAVTARAEQCGENGTAIAEAVAAVIEDPMRPLLGDPSPGGWADPGRLPPVLLRGGAAALPRTAVTHLIAALSMWAPRMPYPGVEAIAEHCDRDSLTRFSLALAQLWISAGAPGDGTWVVHQLGRFGDEEAAELLDRHLPRWFAPRPAVAAAGIEALTALPAAIGYPVLHRISRGAAKRKLRDLAAERCAAVAARAGTDPERLADRLAPAFGLDAPGGLALDYGPRAFRATVGERLRLEVTDANGKARARLPQGGVRDDPVAVADAKARFQTLSKSLRSEAAFQTARLEDAMRGGRRWSRADFARLTAHPVLSRLAAGLLWLHETPEGPQGFRLAEDGSLADVHDKAVELPEDAAVRLAHPALIGPDLAAWTEVFTDYAILQPFDQLARPALTLTPEEANSGVLHRFIGAEATFEALRTALEWRPLRWGPDGPEWTGSPITHRFGRTLPGSVHVHAEIDPSPDTDAPDPQGRHRVTALWFAPTKNRRRGAAVLRGDAVDPVLVAELLADLTRATGIR